MVEIPVIRQMHPQVKIGDSVFDVRLSEADILERQCALYNKFTRLMNNTPGAGASDDAKAQYVDEVVCMKRGMLQLVNDVLGEGAFEAITGGGFVDDTTLAQITVMVREAAIDAIAKEVERVYE